jgi:hypothetical protein
MIPWFNLRFVFFLVLAFSGIALLWAGDEPGRLNFSHKKHLQDAGLECLDCHTNAPTNSGGGKTNHPTMENCKKCHEDAMAGKNCAMCHPDSTTQKPFKVELHHKNFSHQDHLQRGVVCTYCHKDVDNVDWATADQLPKMEVCLTCHNNKTAPRNCRTCHEDPELKRPSSHNRADFTGRGHGRDARFSKYQCEKCHDESYCDRCHRGRDKRAIHEPNFEFTHGLAARKGDRNCTVCHESEGFCAACHEGRRP